MIHFEVGLTSGAFGWITLSCNFDRWLRIAGVRNGSPLIAREWGVRFGISDRFRSRIDRAFGGIASRREFLIAWLRIAGVRSNFGLSSVDRRASERLVSSELVVGVVRRLT